MSDWRRRLAFHHAPLAVASGAIVVLFSGLSPFSNGRLSMAQFVGATGYVALALVGLTLVIGPINLFLRRRNLNASWQFYRGVHDFR